MDTTVLAAGAVLAIGIALSVPLGWVARIRLSESRHTHLDGLRAVAAFMVVCSHYIVYARLIAKEPAASPLVDALGAVGVQIFFGITGFLFARKAMAGQISIPDLVSSRMRRIAPLYVVAMTAAICLAAHIMAGAPNAPTPTVQEILRAYAYGWIGGKPTIAGMRLVGQIGQAWTLHWEWGFYVMVPLLGVIFKRPAWTLTALSVALVCLTYLHSPWAFFLPGVVCALVEPKIRIGESTKIVFAVSGFAAFGYALTMPAYGWAQPALCAVGFPALLFGDRRLLSVKPLRLLGEVSYSTYLLHLIVASAFFTYVQTNWDIYRTVEDKTPLALAAVAAMFALSFTTYALIERPFMRKPANQPPGTIKQVCMDPGSAPQ